MKFKKPLIIFCIAIAFLAVLTSYVNRILFPQLVKKIAIEKIQESIKRKVEINSIHFNWVKGFIIDKIRVYEKNSTDSVFIQAEQVSFGIIFVPGFKHYRLSIPFINISSPSIHLVRTSQDAWNFSDLIPATPTMAPTTPEPTPATPKKEEPSALEITWGGITISNGKFQVDDESTPHPWGEFFDNINLKLSLSYKGITYDFTADIPEKNGSIAATVHYQPLTYATQAKIRLKNIDSASYLSLINIPELHLESGIIEEVNLSIDYTKEKTAAQGDVSIKSLDISKLDQGFKGDIQIHNLNALYQDGDISARGQLALNNAQTQMPGLIASGSVQTSMNNFELTKQGLDFSGSLRAQDMSIKLKDRQVSVDALQAENIKVKKDKDGVQSIGTLKTKNLSVIWPNQKLQGDISLKGMTLDMKDANDIAIKGDIEAEQFATNINNDDFKSQHILFENTELNILNQKNVSLNTRLSIDGLKLSIGENMLASASSIKTDKLSFSFIDGIIKASSTLNTTKGKVVLDHHKTIEAEPRLELTMEMPLTAPDQLSYKGSITLSDASIRGFSPIEALDNVELDADFQNDQATINALSINLLDTNFRINGTIKNFKNPLLNINAEADELNLSKIKDLVPQIADQYGLNAIGTSSVKIKFEGQAANPLTGNILAVASFKNASVSSSKLHQELNKITGIIEATPNSLKWRDFTAYYQNKQFSLVGSLDDFKNPKIITTLDSSDFHLKADLVTSNDLITINSISGKYLNAAFDTKGTISLEKQGPVFDINSNTSFLLENIVKMLPADQLKNINALNPTGIINLTASVKGTAADWKNYTLNAQMTSPTVTLMGYRLTDMKIDLDQAKGKVKNLNFDGKLYGGTVHAVGSMDLTSASMPYDLALNIDSTDMHQLKMDSPLKLEEINGKFYLTTVAHGTAADFKNTLHATGSMAIRDGFLADFNLFKGLLGILNDVMRLGQVEITDLDGNFSIDNQKITTDNLRFKGPTIVLLGKGWVNFDQACDLNITVDLSSGVVPAIAHDVLNTLNIRIYDKISNPKFKKKISVPQVINTLLKNLLQ